MAQVLNIKLILGSDGNGNTALYQKIRGIRRMIDQLILLIEKSEKNRG